MRSVVIAGVVSATVLVVAGCASVGLNAGLPVLTKNGEGILVNETGGLPDLERGRQARLMGKPEQAMKDLRPLAEQGYADAMTLLAATYLDLGTVASRDEAEKWYRRAYASRPDAGLSLARLLIGRGDRKQLPTIDALISEAERSGNDEVDSVKLQRYMQFPDLDTSGEGDRIARNALNSSFPSVQMQALSWYRQNIAKGNNAAALEASCRKLLEIDPSCYIDLAHFYRYRQEKDRLEKIVDEALVVFKAGSSAPKAAESARLYQPPTQYSALASRLAAAMVDQVNEDDGGESADDGSDAEQPDLDFEDDDFEGDRIPSSSPSNITVTGAAQENPAEKSPAAEAPAAAPAAQAAAATQVVELADKILRWMLSKGGEFATEAAVVAVHYPFLLPDLDLEKALTPAVQAGVPSAISALADFLFNSQRIEARRPLEAIELYRRCLNYTATEVRANGRLGRVYAMGILGNPDPEQALKFYLLAARAGSPQAYSSLARMFSGMAGIQVNRVNTYVFAKRSQDAGRPLTFKMRKLKRINELRPNIESTDMFEVLQVKLLDQITTEMAPIEMERAQRLYQMEKALQPVLKQPIPADIYSKGRP